MGATTTEGTGFGSVPNKKKVESLVVNKLIGPKIIVAGVLTLQETSSYVQIPAPIGKPSDYCIILTGSSVSNPFISRSLSVISADTWQFEVTAGHHDIVNYVVIKTGMA